MDLPFTRTQLVLVIKFNDRVVWPAQLFHWLLDPVEVSFALRFSGASGRNIAGILIVPPGRHHSQDESPGCREAWRRI